MTGPRQTTGSVSSSRIRFMDISCRPVWVVTGKRYSSVPMQCSWTPKDLGTEGPVMSASSTAQLKPRRCISDAIRHVTRDLPTPPLPLTTAITFLTLAPGRRLLRKLSAVRSAQSCPQVEQSCVHSLIVVFCLSVVITYYTRFFGRFKILLFSVPLTDTVRQSL